MSRKEQCRGGSNVAEETVSQRIDQDLEIACSVQFEMLRISVSQPLD